MGPQFQKYLWWKKYITNIQMIQFIMTFLHSAQLVYTDCGYPRWSVFFTLPNAIFFYFLFNDFYQKSYKKKAAAAAAEKAANDKVNNNALLTDEQRDDMHNGKCVAVQHKKSRSSPILSKKVNWYWDKHKYRNTLINK